MLGDAFKRVKSGDPLRISAPAWNAAMDAAQAFANRQLSQEQGASGWTRTRIVLVHNNTGSALDACAVVGLGDDPIFAPNTDEKKETFKRQVGFEGVVPAEGTHEGRFAVLLAPLAADDIGPAVIDGVCPVQVNVADENDQYAEIADGDTTRLASGLTGSAQILWVAPGTGTQWAVVRLGPPQLGRVFCGVPSSAFSGGSQITLSPSDCHGTATGEDDIDVYVQSDGSSYSMNNSTTVPTTEVVPYVQGPTVSGTPTYYVLGRPVLTVVDVQYDLSSHKIQKKYRDTWGTFAGTVSDWQDIDTAVDCTTTGGS